MARTPATRQEPRRRILQAALELVAGGGYEALQVRAISERAGVSSRTIYANFPSLDSLLIVRDRRAVSAAVHAVHDGAAARSQRGGTDRPHESATSRRRWTSNRELTVCAAPGAAQWQARCFAVRSRLRRRARDDARIGDRAEGPTARDREVAELLESIWFAALVGWASGTTADGDIRRIMRQACSLLLPEPRSEV